MIRRLSELAAAVLLAVLLIDAAWRKAEQALADLGDGGGGIEPFAGLRFCTDRTGCVCWCDTFDEGGK